MCPEIDTTIAIKRYPGHETCGGVFVFIQQTEEQPDCHRVCRMRAAETVQSTHIASNQMERTDSRLMRRTETADNRFEHTAANIIAQSDSHPKTDENNQHCAPITVFVCDQTNK